MATSATAINDSFSPIKATASATTGTATGGAIGTAAVGKSSSYSTPLTVNVTATSGTSINQVLQGCPCCVTCVPHIHGPNGCEFIQNNYCVRFYNFRGASPGSYSVLFPQEATFSVKNSFQLIPGTTTVCNTFRMIPGTFSFVENNAGFNYSISETTVLFINDYFNNGLFRLSMAGQFTVTDINGQLFNAGQSVSFGIREPGWQNDDTTINCESTLLIWEFAQLSNFPATIGSVYFDVEFKYCPPPVMFSPESFTNSSSIISQSKQRISVPCIHRGETLEESASCGCGGAVLTECKIYGQCRPYGTAADAQICTRCEDYEPAS